MMPKNILTLLGCSSSLSLTLLTGYSARANTVEYVFTAPTANEEEVIDCECQNTDASAGEISEDLEGELAITTFGCDCAGCRNIVRSRLQEGIL